MALETSTGWRPSLDLREVAARASAICLEPDRAWPAIKAQAGGVLELYVGYFFVVFSSPALGTFLAGAFRGKLFEPLGMAIVQYVASLIGLLVVALLAEKLAPRFGGLTDRVAALKLFGFSMTPACLSGVLTVFGSSTFVTLLQVVASLYGVKLLWDGAPLLTTVPAAKLAAYLGCAVLAAIAFWAIAAALLSVA